MNLHLNLILQQPLFKILIKVSAILEKGEFFRHAICGAIPQQNVRRRSASIRREQIRVPFVSQKVLVPETPSEASTTKPQPHEHQEEPEIAINRVNLLQRLARPDQGCVHRQSRFPLRKNVRRQRSGDG